MHTPIITDEVKGIIRGYVFIWGSPTERDSYDTWFDKARPPELDLDLLPIALRYEHGMDGAVTFERIGTINKIGFDDSGCFFIAELDRSCPFFDRVVAELQNGTPDGPLRTSSGTISYLADFHDDGAFKIWPVGEVSLTSMASEHRIPNVEILRSEQSRDVIEVAPETKTPIEQDIAPDGEIAVTQPNQETTQMLEEIQAVLASLAADAGLEEIFAALIAAGFNAEDLQAAIAALAAPEENASEEDDEEARAKPMAEQLAVALATVLDAKQTEEVTEEARSLRAENARLRGEAALSSALRSAPPVPATARGDATDGGNNIQVGEDLQYMHLSANQMAIGHSIMRSNPRCENPSDGYNRAMAVKFLDKINAGESAFSSRQAYYGMRAAMNYATRADELMTTTTSGQGSQWVTTEYSDQLWERIRNTRVIESLNSRGLMELEVMQGASSVVVPLETADPTWHSVAEASSIDNTGRPEITVQPSVVTTSNVTITPNITKASVIISDELVEDSIVAALPRIEFQLQESAADHVEYLFFNGDTVTTASTNLNLIDGTPTTGIAGSAYLVTNGALKLPIITNTANSRDGGALADTDFLETRKLFPSNLADDPDKIVYYSDVSTNLKAMALTQVKTQDVFANATIENGRLTGVWGSLYLASGQIALANTAGKISATAGNNTLGRLLAVVPKYWALVWKRRIVIESARDIQSGSTVVVASMRLAWQYRSTEASAVSYNITV